MGYWGRQHLAPCRAQQCPVRRTCCTDAAAVAAAAAGTQAAAACGGMEAHGLCCMAGHAACQVAQQPCSLLLATRHGLACRCASGTPWCGAGGCRCCWEPCKSSGRQNLDVPAVPRCTTRRRLRCTADGTRCSCDACCSQLGVVRPGENKPASQRVRQKPRPTQAAVTPDGHLSNTEPVDAARDAQRCLDAGKS